MGSQWLDGMLAFFLVSSSCRLFICFLFPSARFLPLLYLHHRFPISNDLCLIFRKSHLPFCIKTSPCSLSLLLFLRWWRFFFSSLLYLLFAGVINLFARKVSPRIRNVPIGHRLRILNTFLGESRKQKKTMPRHQSCRVFFLFSIKMCWLSG